MATKKKSTTRAPAMGARATVRDAVSATFKVAGASTKGAHAAAQQSGAPTFDLLARQNPGDDFFLLSGFVSAGGNSATVTGKLPMAVHDWLQEQRPKRGARRKSAQKIAMLLTIQNYLAQGRGIKESRFLAAEKMCRPQRDERDVRRIESEARALPELKDFKQFLVAHDRIVWMQHRLATVVRLPDRIEMNGLFWRVIVGEDVAQLVECNGFLPLVQRGE